MPHDVFISYSSHDRPVADAICERLEAAGVRCWIAPRDILPGDTYGGAIIRAISEATIMLLVFSEHANASPQILREVERAVAREVAVLPVRIDDVKPADELEYFISTHHWLDALPPPPEQHLDRITSVVQRVLATRGKRGEAALEAGAGGVVDEPRRETVGDGGPWPGGSAGEPATDPAAPPLVRIDPAPASRSPRAPGSPGIKRRLVAALAVVLVSAAAAFWANRVRDRALAREVWNAAAARDQRDSSTPASTEPTYSYGEVDVQPLLLNEGRIDELTDRYLPPLLRRSRVVERVEMEVRVRVDGSVDDVTVLSKAEPEVADAAREVGLRLAFSPGQIKGTPVPVWVPVAITFDASR